jgi:hypothetical protein
MVIILLASASAAWCQTDPRTTTFKGPIRLPLPCRGQEISARHISDDSAMGGQNSIVYGLKNVSPVACTLKGYPRYELLDKVGKIRPRGRAINSQQLPGDDEKLRPQQVMIHPGEEAWFRVHYNSGGAGHVGKPCPVSRKARIVAPGTTRVLVLKESITSCGAVEVSAVRGAPVPE